MFDPLGISAQKLYKDPSIFTKLPRLKRSGGLLVTRELEAYRMVIACFPNNYVMPQVHLYQVFEIDDKAFDEYFEKAIAQHWVGNVAAVRDSTRGAVEAKIGKKSVDFLICTQDSQILGAVEVDGEEHAKEPQASFDYAKNLLFVSINRPLLRIKNEDVERAYQSWQRSNLTPFKQLLTAARSEWDTFAADPKR